MSRSSIRTSLLLALAVPLAVTGGWALAAPGSWFHDFPGFGRHWLTALGPYDEHLARDFGGALLALAVLLAWTAAAPATQLRRAVPAALLVWAIPHLVFHVAHAGELPAADDAVNLVLLTLSVVIPLGLLLLADERPLRLRSPAGRPEGWRLPPARPRNPVARFVYAASRRRFGHVLGPFAVTAHNPLLLAGYCGLELALERANRIDRRLEELAALRAATMTGCPFCIDIGSALLAKLGSTPQQLREVPNWRQSGAFSDDERLVVEYAEAMTATPVAVTDELFERLRNRFDEAAIVELTATIAIENYRGRFNHAVGLGSEGFCQLPGGDGRPVKDVVA